jgi:hypothetical protein
LRARFALQRAHALQAELGAGSACERLIEAAWRSGAKFDLWDECFDYDLWRSAFEKFGIDVEAAAQKQFDPADALPWDHLAGPDKKYLLGHLDDAMTEVSRIP